MSDKKTENKVASISANILKSSINDEKRLATFIILEPQDSSLETTDLHLDWYDAETIEKACHDFNLHCRKANLMHLMPTTSYVFVQSYTAPFDGEINGVSIQKGTWLGVIKVLEDWVWDGIKDGTFTGLSIQATGYVQNLEGDANA